MKTTEQPTIKYENPPINEIVCGIRFDSIQRLRSGHLGVLWQKFKSDFPKIEDRNFVGPVSKADSKNPDQVTLPRVWFIHKNELELIQVQRNWFIHNWRRIQPDDRYPGYKKVVENFERYLHCFQEFLTEEDLGSLVEKEYELTYIDLIPKGQGWENLGDLEKVFPHLLSLTRQSILSNDVKSINWQTILDLPNDLGQLGIAIRSANRVSNSQQLLHIEFKALSNQVNQPRQIWFEAAHDIITKFFSNLVSDEIQERFWGRKS